MKRSEALSTALNLSVVGVLAFLLFRPGGLARSAIDDWRAGSRLRAQVEQAWPRLTGVGARLDSGAGPVRLIEFSDYECVYCQAQHNRFTAFLATHPDVGIVYRHFPLDMHPAARGAARAAICAEAQGAFAAMHRRLFASSDWRADTNWTREANAAGIPDTSAFAACLASPQTTARLEEDLALGEELGVTATPSFAYQRGLYVGSLSDSALLNIIKR